MIRFIFLLSLMLCHFLQAQNNDYEVGDKRELRVWKTAQDTIADYQKVKRYRDGNIKLLEQQCKWEVDSTFYLLIEHYKDGAYWGLWSYKSFLTKVKKRKASKSYEHYYEYELDGKQYQFNSKGLVNRIQEYKRGEQVSDIEITYYDNGNVKYAIELKDELCWNVLTYKFPDGEDYAYGDFKNGEGLIVHLNDKGVPCLRHQVKGKKTREEDTCNK